MLYFIGLGLADEKDITVKGLEIVKRAERVYLEAYTAILLVDKEQLESFYGRPLILADREMVESSSEEILKDADKSEVAFLVVGDPFGATTHADLSLRASQSKPPIPTSTIHNASILNAIGTTGLSLYNFGQTTSMPFFTPSWKPSSWYDRLAENVALGLHSLVLLDIKVKEPDLEVLARKGKVVYEPPRFMTAAQCCAQMLEVEEERDAGVCGKDMLVVGAARVGSSEMSLVAGTVREVAEVDFGRPLHSVVLVGRRCHDVEREMMRGYAVNRESFDEAWEKGRYGKS